jgi:hypothetical protein
MLETKNIIQKSLKNPSYLRYWLESFMNEEITKVKKSLKEPMLGESNPYLIQEIRDLLKKRHTKALWITKIFNQLFHINREHQLNKELAILIDRLNTDIHKVKNASKKAKSEREKLLKLLEVLKDLRMGFGKTSYPELFLKEIDDKIALIESYNITLLFNEKSLLELQIFYKDIKAKG